MFYSCRLHVLILLVSFINVIKYKSIWVKCGNCYEWKMSLKQQLLHCASLKRRIYIMGVASWSRNATRSLNKLYTLELIILHKYYTTAKNGLITNIIQTKAFWDIQKIIIYYLKHVSIWKCFIHCLWFHLVLSSGAAKTFHLQE